MKVSGLSSLARSGSRPVMTFFALLFALASVLTLAAAANAQSADDQYGTPTSPEGPAAGSQCEVQNDTDDVVNEGDVVVCEGDFTVSEGSSVVLQDSDGTQGTFVDGQNAEVSSGSLIIEVAGDPINVVGGNDVLNTEGLFVVATTGIAAVDGKANDGKADDEAAGVGGGTTGGTTGGDAGTAGGDAGAAAGGAAGDDDDGAGGGAILGGGLLPDTGGSLVLLAAGGLALIGGGALLLRARQS